MDNFYEEHKGYIELSKELHDIDFDLVYALTEVVSKAMKNGMDRIIKSRKEGYR